MDTVRGGKFGLANTNKMLKSYQGLTGLKTGYIREAGFCISASAERDGLSLVAVVMAAPTKENRTADATALLNYGFANFTAYTPAAERSGTHSGDARHRGDRAAGARGQRLRS